MLLLRILTFPIALFAFATLYTIAIKAPHAVEVGSLVLWIILPLLIVTKLARAMLPNATLN
ncbi:MULTISPECIES: hypothetical protein [Rhizobiaceae]|uniref:Uncharacterized protein n=1 Tax=Mycoplana rhizolycopersici TaxID=2746702 RepID=A0ABX2QAJ1_9HYPH|nr:MULTISPECIES: hypothetical protein [Rhizobium/Agrobacterium group]NVP54744.1 hypothetical protein [Rhizobium rhizolycopersici]TCV76008.1 hypothetical protein EDE09_101291 [Neorhizobium sp. S3-V5DH]TQN60086.1 hypothetical protein FLX27_17150 [Agrobacterium tumefaciens]